MSFCWCYQIPTKDIWEYLFAQRLINTCCQAFEHLPVGWMRNGISVQSDLHLNFSYVSVPFVYTFPQKCWAISNNPSRLDFRVDLTPRLAGGHGSRHAQGQWGLHRGSQPLTPPLWFLKATDPTLSPPPGKGETASSTQRRLWVKSMWLGLWEMLKSWPPPQIRGPAGAEEWRHQDLRVQKTGVGLLSEEAGSGDTGHPVSPGWLTQPLAYLSDLRLFHSILPYLAACVTRLKLRDDYGTPVLWNCFGFLVRISPLLTFWIESPSLPTYLISIHPLIHPSIHPFIPSFVHPFIHLY